jgi:inner membrane protein
MLAINHVTFSTATTLALSIYTRSPFFLPFLIFVVFAALIPDIDHPKSEISNFFPGINKVLPHRGITHSVLGVGIFSAGIFTLLQRETYFSILLLVASLIGVYFTSKVMRTKIHEINNTTGDFFSVKQIRFMLKAFTVILYVFLAMVLLLIWKESFRLQIAVLLSIGYITHIFGDFITKDGIPVFWPLKFRSGLKLFRTGGSFETFFGIVLVFLNAYLISVFFSTFSVQTEAYWIHYLMV